MFEFEAPVVRSIQYKENDRKRKRVILVAVPGGDPFDLIGPMAVLRDANWQLENAGRADLGYDMEVVSNEPGTVFEAGGLKIAVDQPCYEIEGDIDTLIFQAVDEDQDCLQDAAFIEWVRSTDSRTRRMVTACVGTYVLAEAGLLDGRRATTHWMACTDFSRRYKDVDLDPDPIFVQDGKYYSSAGVTAILDLLLALVEEDFGSEVALRVAQSLVLFLRRPANQSQFSVQLQQRMSGDENVQGTLAHIADNLDADLSVESLAELANMSPRNFTRVFTRETGITPGKFVEKSRLEAARSQLEQSVLPIGEVARRCGYGSSDGLRASFDRNLGVGPGEYRRRFTSSGIAASN